MNVDKVEECGMQGRQKCTTASSYRSDQFPVYLVVLHARPSAIRRTVSRRVATAGLIHQQREEDAGSKQIGLKREESRFLLVSPCSLLLIRFHGSINGLASIFGQLSAELGWAPAPVDLQPRIDSTSFFIEVQHILYLGRANEMKSEAATGTTFKLYAPSLRTLWLPSGQKIPRSHQNDLNSSVSRPTRQPSMHNIPGFMRLRAHNIYRHVLCLLQHFFHHCVFFDLMKFQLCSLLDRFRRIMSSS
ncbi:hypothetical protein C8R44DRAFT_755116 [Mycena epipterygia]|nr:hypothetical protein C8R44DRAFT_755116 [Mycena epipterygia]